MLSTDLCRHEGTPWKADITLRASPTLEGLSRSGFPVSPTGPARPRAMQAGAAILAHLVVLAAAARLAVSPLPLAPEPAGFPLIMATVDVLGETAIPSASTPSARLAPPAALSVDTPGRIAVPHTVTRVPLSTPAPATAMPKPATPAAHAATAAAPHSQSLPLHESMPLPGSPSHGSMPLRDTAPPAGDALPGLEARIDDAVRAAAILPNAARRQHRQGRARVKFSYQDGAVDNVQVVVSSDSMLLDSAALAAVRRAHYPAPPAVMRGRKLSLLVWIDFRLELEPG